MIEPLGPELFVTIEPLERVAHRLGIEAAGDGAPGLAAVDQPGIGQHVEMLHHGRQRHRKRRREFADREPRLLGKPHHQRTPGGVGKRRKGAIEVGALKVNHLV